MSETGISLPPLTAEHFRPGAAVTDLPITQGEDGEHYGFGWIDRTQFAEAANAIDEALGISGEGVEPWTKDAVEYRWAVTTASGGPDADFGFRWATSADAGSFPVTVVRP